MSDPNETITAINSGRKITAAEAIAVLARDARENQRTLEKHDGRITAVERWRDRILGGWKAATIIGGIAVALSGLIVFVVDRL